MKKYLIKTPFGYVLVSDECNNCNGLGYTCEHDPFDPHEFGQCQNCPIQVECEQCEGTGIFKNKISSIPHIEGTAVMQLSDCIAIERGFDVRKISIDEANEYLTFDDCEFAHKRNLIQHGIEKALELTADRIFTKADVIAAYQEGSRYSDDNVHVYPNAIKYAESLTPSKWEVEYTIENGKITNLKRV